MTTDDKNKNNSANEESTNKNDSKASSTENKEDVKSINDKKNDKKESTNKPESKNKEESAEYFNITKSSKASTEDATDYKMKIKEQEEKIYALTEKMEEMERKELLATITSDMPEDLKKDFIKSVDGLPSKGVKNFYERSKKLLQKQIKSVNERKSYTDIRNSSNIFSTEKASTDGELEKKRIGLFGR